MTTDAESAVRRPARGALALALPLAFVSGAAALVYEVAWTRRALLVVGSTATASAVVLAAFLGGLGLGGRLGGGRADRVERPLLFYGALEIGAALWAAAFPWIVEALESAYVGLGTPAGPTLRWLLRLLVAALAVGPPALALGATYPALVASATRSGSRPGLAAAWIYGVNTAGAVLGALWCGFEGIFDLGIAGSLRLAAACAAGVGLVAIVVGRLRSALPRREIDVPNPVPYVESRTRVPRGALASAAVGGLVGLGLQAAGSRVLVFFVEGFTPSFAAMLATFLAGLALGSLLLGPLLSRLAKPSLALGALFLLAGLAVWAEAGLLPGFEDFLRSVRRSAYAGEGVDPFTAQHGTALVGAAVAFGLPAFLLGATYPLAVAWASRGDTLRTGAAAGRVAVWNTVGAVAGPILVLLLGRIGAKDDAPGGPLLSWTLCGAVSTLAGAAFLVASLGMRRRTIALGAVVGVAAGFLVPTLLFASTPAALVRASHVVRASAGVDGPRRLVAVESDEVTTASVVATAANEEVLYTDDFAAAATGRSYPYMRLLGHLPVLGAVVPRRALVIAFGTGTTAGAVARHPDVDRLEVVDTSRAVLHLATHFEAANHRVLEDDRVHVRADDGRHALRLHASDLDVVTLEPLLPTTPAALPFYTREFYELARSRVVDGGVVCQWVPIHAMPLDVYAALLRTFFEAFPNGSLWFFEQSTVLVGHVGNARPTAATVQTRLAQVEASLRVAGLGAPEQVAFGWVATGKRVLETIRRAPPSGGDRPSLALEPVTDDRPLPERYASPRAPIAQPWLHQTLEWLASLVDAGDVGDAVSVPEISFVPLERLPLMHLATKQALLGRTEEAKADALLARGFVEPALVSLDAAEQALGDAARAIGAEDRALSRHLARVERLRLTLVAERAVAKADRLRAAGKTDEADAAANDAVTVAERAWSLESLDPLGTGRPRAGRVYANALLRRGRCVEAEEVLASARRQWPWDEEAERLLVGVVAHRRGQGTAAELPASVKAALAASPPCAVAPDSAVRAEVAAVRRAHTLGRAGDLHLEARRLVDKLAATGVPPSAVVAEIRALGAGGYLEVDVERDALLRALDPTDPAFAADFAADPPDRWRPAIRAAGQYGFERLALHDLAVEKAMKSADEARRLALVDALLDDGTPWAIDRLVDLLLDSSPKVRAAAWSKVSTRLSAAARSSAGYDPAASEDSRRAAVDRVRELVRAK